MKGNSFAIKTFTNKPSIWLQPSSSCVGNFFFGSNDFISFYPALLGLARATIKWHFPLKSIEIPFDISPFHIQSSGIWSFGCNITAFKPSQMKNTSKNLIIAAGTNCLILWEIWFWPRKHVLFKKDYNVMVTGKDMILMRYYLNLI